VLTYNEGKACDAIVRHLEAREGARRTALRSPEDEHHSDPVELVWKLGSQLFALEHTGIEPFDGHVQLEAEAKLHFDPIKEALTGALPPGVIELHLPAKAMQGLKKPAIRAIQGAIADWVRATAPTVPMRRYADYIGDIGPAAVPGVPFKLRLLRFETMGFPDRLQIVHSVTEDRGKARTDRIRRACEKKFPKLAAWKKREGAKTILILEDNDVQLTNQVVVSETFLPIALARPDRPDETYMVASCMSPWWAWPILVGDESYFDMARRGDQPGWEINQNTLVALTKR